MDKVCAPVDGHGRMAAQAQPVSHMYKPDPIWDKGCACACGRATRSSHVYVCGYHLGEVDINIILSYIVIIILSCIIILITSFVSKNNDNLCGRNIRPSHTCG
jgi:hypothetical protein